MGQVLILNNYLAFQRQKVRLLLAKETNILPIVKIWFSLVTKFTPSYLSLGRMDNEDSN